MGCSGSKSTETSSSKAPTSAHNEGTAQKGDGTSSDEVYVTVEEATEHIQNELGLNEERAKCLVAKVNKNQDGKVANDELVQLWTELKKRKEAIKAEFLTYDPDKAGRVSLDDAVSILKKKSGGHIKEDDLKRMLAYYDQDNSGSIDYEEFTYFYSAVGYRQKAFHEHWFKELDKDKSGDLGPDELKTWLMEECLLEEKQACSMACAFDADKSRSLDRNEFKKFFDHLFSEGNA